MTDSPENAPDTSGSIGRWMAIGFWLVLLGFGVAVAQRVLDARAEARRPVTTADAAGGYSLTLSGDARGHYSVTATVNGAPVEFLVDTGATGIALPGAVADRLGLARGRPFPVQTAAGTRTAWSTRLESLTVGPFRREDLQAWISPDMEGETGLLGMSFLRHFELVQRDGNLTLREP